MNKETKKNIYLGVGIGVGLVVVVGTALIIRKRSGGDSKIDLSKVDWSKFDSPDQPGSGKKCMDRTLVKMLLKIEQKTKLPILDSINSAARSNYWNRKVGGVSGSAHKIPTCKAVDIGAATKEIRDKIVKAAKEVGFKRIGIGSRFVHLDNDETKPQLVAWGYPAGKKPPYNPFA